MSESKKGRAGCLFPAIMVAVGMLLLLFTIVVLYWARQASSQSQVQAIVDDLRRKGVPVDNAGLQSRYDSETTLVGADEWFALLHSLQSPDFVSESTPLPVIGSGPEIPASGAWSEEDATREFLKRKAGLYEEMQRLVEKAKPYRATKKFESFSTMLPEVQEARQAARFAGLYGEVALRDGDGEALWKAIQVQRSVSDQLYASPYLVSSMVRIAIDGMSIGLVKRGLERDVWGAEELNIIQQELMKSISIDDRWKRGIEAERAMFLAACEDPKQFKVLGSPTWGTIARGQDNLLYLDYLEKAERFEVGDLNTFREEGVAWGMSLRKETQGSLWRKFETARTASTIPALPQAADSLVRDVMLHRMAVLGCGLRLFQKRHGKMPATLDELADVGIDPKRLVPIGDRPFGYRVVPECLLWGFEIGQGSSTPDSPPEAGTSSWAETWVWRFP